MTSQDWTPGMPPRTCGLSVYPVASLYTGDIRRHSDANGMMMGRDQGQPQGPLSPPISENALGPLGTALLCNPFLLSSHRSLSSLPVSPMIRTKHVESEALRVGKCAPSWEALGFRSCGASYLTSAR